MSGAGYRISADTTEVQAALARLADRAADLYPAMDAIGASLVDSTRHRFGLEAGPDGTPWRPSRRAIRTGGRTLAHKRRLVGSITHVAADQSVEVGTNVPYAAIHQFGGTITRYAQSRPIYRNLDAVRSGEGAPFVRRSRATLETWHAVPEYTITMPARPYLGADAADRAEMLAIVGDHLTGAADA